jgi:hemerythrin
MENKKVFISYGVVKHSLMIVQMHDTLIEMENNPLTQQKDIDQRRDDIKSTLIDFLNNHFLTRDMVVFCTTYLKYEDVMSIVNHHYNYNKLLLILKP